MSDIFYIKEGDTSPALLYTLSPTVDLTGASVVFNMRLRSDGSVKVSRQAAVIVSPATDGVVRYDWDADDTDTAGEYQAEFEVTYADSTVETFPNKDFITVKIDGDIA